MPILAEHNERPGCLPSTKDETMLPQIKQKGNHEKSNTLNARSLRASMPNGLPDALTNRGDYDGRQLIQSSAPGSVSSTPFKLPTIDRSFSNSVTSLSSRSKFGQRKSRGTSRDRGKLRRSPSCPSDISFWQDDPDDCVPGTPETCKSRLSNSRSPSKNNSYVRACYTHRDDSSGVKLPGIFQTRNIVNSSFTLSTSTADDSGHNSRDTSPFAFKREGNFVNIARRDLSPDHHAAMLSSRREEDTDPSQQRSTNQSAALLLPISTGHDMKGQKGKRKRKKGNEILTLTDGTSESERLLREKLGAIECRSMNGNTPRGEWNTPRGEVEKTSLSDTAFIDQVKDETTYANNETTTLPSVSRDNKADNMTSKPPVYQNTPTRIKTKVASVRV